MPMPLPPAMAYMQASRLRYVPEDHELDPLMNLLLLNHNLEGKGTWHRAWQFGRELARRGHRVTVWTAAPNHFYRPARTTRDGVTVLQTPSWAPLAGPDDGWGPLDIVYRSLAILRQPFDLCYAFANPPSVTLPAWLARRVRRRPLLYDWCDWYEGGVYPKRRQMRTDGLILPGSEPRWQKRIEAWDIRLERRALRQADRVTVISQKLFDLSLLAGRRPEDVLLLPNGADLQGIRPLAPRACRAELGLPEKGLYLGYTANYHPDQELLLEALATACRAVPELKMIVAGPPFAEELVRRLDLRDRIILLGVMPSSRIPLLLGAADALALPLEDNAHNIARMPFKFTEYLAAGRPIVTNPIGDLARWFAEGAGSPGLASPPDPASYGEAIRRVFAPDADRAAMGAAARRLAETEFDWARLTDRLETFIAGLQQVRHAK